MKIYHYMFFVSILFFASVSCSKDNVEFDTAKSQTIEFDEELNNAILAPAQHPSIIACRDAYDLVIQDSDNWEIMMNQVRERVNLNTKSKLWSYKGKLIYLKGTILVKGDATAIFDSRTNCLTVCAVDSLFNQSFFTYSLIIESNGVNPIGTYCYFEKPERMNKISTKIVKGYVGEVPPSGINVEAQSSQSERSAELSPEELEAIAKFIPSKHLQEDFNNSNLNLE